MPLFGGSLSPSCNLDEFFFNGFFLSVDTHHAQYKDFPKEWHKLIAFLEKVRPSRSKFKILETAFTIFINSFILFSFAHCNLVVNFLCTSLFIVLFSFSNTRTTAKDTSMGSTNNVE
jgi:hypothetical protein